MIRQFLFLIFGFLWVFSYAGEKRALIIAIGIYPSNSGWDIISSVNDARLMRTVLLKQGFDDGNITTLADVRATKANILKSLENLISKSNKNDVVVFHFSGHGQQITDQNGDELDGYDEALIPYDAQNKISPQYKGDNHIRDDELNDYLYRMRKKVGSGGDVIFFLDACHSGTATRGQEDDVIYRGTNEKFVIDKSYNQNSQKDKQGFDEQNFHKERSSEELSPFVIISASGQQELNMEIKDQNNIRYGSLTYALGKVLTTNREKLIYSALFDRLCNEMWAGFAGKHHQTPQFEGSGDKILFGGNTIEVPPHCNVVKVINTRSIIVNVGELSGLNVGSEICFYPINTIKLEKTKLLARGTVKQLGLVESTIEIASPFDKNQIIDSWGFVTAYRWPGGIADENKRRADILRRATAYDPSLNVDFEIVPVKTSSPLSGSNSFKIDDIFQIRISNKGTKDAFFQLIDIQPDNQINLLFDAGILSPNDLSVKVGQTILVEDKFRMSQPAGVEMLKLIASEKQLDFSVIETRVPVQNRNAQPSEFEQLLDELYGNTERGGSIYFSKINIFTRTFTIKEK